jgi:hypothetical protein
MPFMGVEKGGGVRWLAAVLPAHTVAREPAFFLCPRIAWPSTANVGALQTLHCDLSFTEVSGNWWATPASLQQTASDAE